jgi:hypothetical protein
MAPRRIRERVEKHQRLAVDSFGLHRGLFPAANGNNVRENLYPSLLFSNLSRFFSTFTPPASNYKPGSNRCALVLATLQRLADQSESIFRPGVTVLNRSLGRFGSLADQSQSVLRPGVTVLNRSLRRFGSLPINRSQFLGPVSPFSIEASGALEACRSIGVNF